MTHTPRDPRLRLASGLLAVALLHGGFGAARALAFQNRPEPPGGGGPGRPGEPVDYTRPFSNREVTRKALITYKPEPGFTKKALKDNVEGLVRLSAVLNFSGKVTDISVVKGLPDGLTEKAVAATGLIKFKPATLKGRAVSQLATVEYSFGL
jgi:TonB family protein